MIFLATILICVKTEWIGNITLYPSNITYSNVTKVGKIVFFIQFPYNGKFSICKEFPCTNQSMILAYNNTTMDTIESSNSSLAILVTDSEISENFTIPTFRIGLDSSKGLLDDKSDSLMIRFNYDCKSLNRSLFGVLATYTCFFIFPHGLAFRHRNVNVQQSPSKLFTRRAFSQILHYFIDIQTAEYRCFFSKIFLLSTYSNDF